MTREEELDWLYRLRSNIYMFMPKAWLIPMNNALDMVIKDLEQEPCEDEYIKVPKKALKYRTAGMVAYNAEWLKNHFDIERAVICGAQEPCGDAISRQGVINALEKVANFFPYKTTGKRETYDKYNEAWNDAIGRAEMEIEQLPSVNPQEPCEKVAQERYADLCEYFGGAKDILKSRKDFKAWLERVKWHIHKAEELYEKYEYKKEPCADAVSRQAVLDCLTATGLKKYDYILNARNKIKNLPSVKPQEPCEDAISRREAIKIFTYNYKGERIPDYDCDNFPVQIAIKKVKKMLRELPPVKPQERTGHWIEKMDACECPYCHKAWDYYDNDTEDFDYCPKCGAKLSENPTGSEPQERSE